MGFFSANCRVCGLEVLAVGADPKGPLSLLTVIDKQGKMIAQGRYGGYGSLEGDEFNPNKTFAFLKNGNARDSWFHTACWEWAGRPGFLGPSTRAEGQGWFLRDDVKDAWNALVLQRRQQRR